MVMKYQKIVLAVATIGLASLTVKPATNPVPFIIWNASESVPIGWYLISKRRPKIGEIAVIKPAEWVKLYASERGYFPQNVWLLKPIFSGHPSIICRFGRHVFIDGKYVAKAKIMDRKHRLLPVWKGCTELTSTQYFVLGRVRDSFDSRYFGLVDRSQFVGTAFPLSGLFK